MNQKSENEDAEVADAGIAPRWGHKRGVWDPRFRIQEERKREYEFRVALIKEREDRVE